MFRCLSIYSDAHLSVNLIISNFPNLLMLCVIGQGYRELDLLLFRLFLQLQSAQLSGRGNFECNHNVVELGFGILDTLFGIGIEIY